MFNTPTFLDDGNNSDYTASITLSGTGHHQFDIFYVNNVPYIVISPTEAVPLEEYMNRGGDIPT